MTMLQKSETKPSSSILKVHWLWDRLLPAAAISMLACAGYYGLFVAPKEQFMGDVYRILYVHVPAAFIAFLAYTVCVCASLVYLFKSSTKADSIAASSAEIGVLFTLLVLISGSIWGRPTWGVWWSWDPRLTTAAIMFFSYVGYLSLRQFVDEPEKRASWAAIVAILIYVNIPIVWFSVRWWNSLHQLQSNKETLGVDIMRGLRFSLLAYLLFFGWFMRLRLRLESIIQHDELSEPPV